MRTNSILSALLLLAMSATLVSCGASNAEILSEARGVEVSLMRNLPTGMVDWIHAQAADVAGGRSDEESVRQAAATHVTGDDPDGQGTDALAFFVMMEAVRIIDKGYVDNQKRTEALGKAGAGIEALTATIDADLSKNSGKEDSEPCACGLYEVYLDQLGISLRQSETWITLTAREPQDIGDAKALRNDLEHMKGTLKEMGETDIIRLQALEDRRSKSIGVITRLMKKASETSSTIIQNMK